MPLSEEELRLLEQMERALVAEDPKLASTLRGTSFQRAARRRMIAGFVVIAVGIALMIGAVMLDQPVLLGVLAFVVMLGGALLAVGATRSPSTQAQAQSQSAGAKGVRDSRHAGFGVVDGGRRQRPARQQRASGSFMERMEERWRRRRERGGL